MSLIGFGDETESEKDMACDKLRLGMREYIDEYNSLIAADTIDGYVDRVFSRTKGMRVWDEAEKEYIDFNAAVGTLALGHGVPEITEALNQQGATLDHMEGAAHHFRFTVTAGEKLYDISPVHLAKELLPLMFPGFPPGQETKITFDVTGSTGVNVGLKLMWKARPGKPQFLTFEKSFHGRHGWSLDATDSKPKVQKKGYPIQSLVAARLPFPMKYEDLSKALGILSRVSLADIGGFLFEYSQGEGGMCWPNIPLMNELLDKCRTLGLLLIDDEVQTGLGRTGKWYAWQHGTVVPDIIITSKALGGRVPMSAVAYRRVIFNYLDNNTLHQGWHSGTYPKYPSGVTSAIVNVKLMQERGVVENAAAMGVYLAGMLAKHSDNDAHGLADYCMGTGFGLLQGLRFFHHSGNPFPEWRDAVLKNLLHAEPVGIITNGAGDSVVRFEPPLVVSKEDIDYLDSVLTKVIPQSLIEVNKKTAK